MASQCAAPLQPSFLHVLGLQDKNPKQPLTVIEQLNVDCDHQAKQYTRSTQQLSMQLGNPTIPIVQPHLSIDGKIICRKFLSALWHVITTTPYHRCLQQKFSWTLHDINNVH